MGRLPTLVKFGSKLVLEILPSVAATVIGGYLLAQIHFARMPAPAPQQTAVAPAPSTPDVPTVREDRAAMREVLKDRRENPEPLAEVRPIVTAAPAATPASAPANPPAPAATPASASAQLPAAMDSISPNEPVEHAAAPNRSTVAAAPVVLPRARPDSVLSVYAPAPPPGLPQAPAAGIDSPLRIAPVAPAAATAPAASVVASPVPPPAAAPVTPEPPAQRGGVFSTISSIVGTAASATGNTVNWVIDLPGKAIEAGGRVIGVNPPPPPNRPFS
jgi:hypothetical protein